MNLIIRRNINQMKNSGWKHFFLEEHLERMIKGCVELNMAFDYDLKFIKEYCDKLIIANKVDFGSIKILYSKNKEEYNLAIYTGDNLYIYYRNIKVNITPIVPNIASVATIFLGISPLLLIALPNIPNTTG